MSYLDAISLRFGRRLPLVLQTEAAECGLACLAMIASYHGYHTSLMELRRRYSISLKGATLKQLIQTADELKFGTRAVRLELNDLNKLKVPCVLHWNFTHFVVLKAVEGKRLTLHDPARGVRHLSLDEVSKEFTGVAMEVWPESDFKPQSTPKQIGLMHMMGRVSGLYRALGQVLVLALSLEIFSLVSPLLLQWTIDNVLVTLDRDLLTTLMIGFALLLVMKQVVGLVRDWVTIYISTLLGVQWQANVFSHLLRLPILYFEKRHLGDVVSRFGSVGKIQQTLTGTFFSTVLDGLMSLATLTLMLFYSPLLAMIAVLAMTLYVSIRLLCYQPLRRASEEQIVHAARVDSHFLETLRGIRTLKLFQRQDERRATWLGLLVTQINAGLRAQKLQLLYAQFNSLIFGLENLLAIGFGASLVIDNQFSVGVLMAFMAYKGQFVGRVASLVDHLFELRMLRIQGERLADIVLHPPEGVHSSLTVPSRAPTTLDINIRGLRYRYSDQEPWVLNGINLNIPPGQSIAITGESGCGKSTLVNLMLGILQPTMGRIYMGESDQRHLHIGIWRSRIGTVLQDDCLFTGSLMENITFFEPSPDLNWAMVCAKNASMHEDILAMPMGYNTLVGDMGTVLSGGQKQRLLLARALYKRPNILILDEATSHLDSACEGRVNSAIKALDVTRIIIAHRAETIDSADRFIRLEGGRIVQDRRVTDKVGPA